MIDTTKINFVLEKINEAIQNSMPHIKNGGEAFIDFYVMRYILISFMVPVLIGLVFIFIGVFIGKKMKWRAEHEIDLLWTMPLLIGFLMFLISMKFGVKSILALNHPVIFTIIEMSEKIK